MVRKDLAIASLEVDPENGKVMVFTPGHSSVIDVIFVIRGVFMDELLL